MVLVWSMHPRPCVAAHTPHRITPTYTYVHTPGTCLCGTRCAPQPGSKLGIEELKALVVTRDHPTMGKLFAEAGVPCTPTGGLQECECVCVGGGAMGCLFGVRWPHSVCAGVHVHNAVGKCGHRFCGWGVEEGVGSATRHLCRKPATPRVSHPCVRGIMVWG